MDNSTHLHSLGNQCSDDTFGPVSCERDFDFTLLFEQSILSILPSAVLLLAVPVRLYQLIRTNRKTLPDPIHAIKILFTILYIVIQLCLVVLWSYQSSLRTRASLPSAALSFVDAIAIFILSHFEHTRSIRPSALLNTYLLLSIVLDAAQIRTLYVSGNGTSIFAIMNASIGIKLALLFLEAQTKRSYLKRPYNEYSPEAISGIFSWSFLTWLNGLFRIGFRKLMTYDDLYNLDEALKSEHLGDRMQEAWDCRSKPESRFALPLATAYCLRWELSSVILPRLFLIAFSYAQPFLISRAIAFLDEPATAESKNIGYGLIGATALIYMGIAVSTVHYKQHYYRVLTMFRGAMVSLIYDRTLTIQDNAVSESAALTLMSTDIDAAIQALGVVNEIWARAIELCIGIWLLARQLGATSILPIILVAACAYGQSRVSNIIGDRRKVWNEAIQKRVAMTSSMLSSMKAVKMMGLSDTLSKIIQSQRFRELDRSKSYRRIIVWLNVLADIPSWWSPVLTFIAFTIQAKIQGAPPLTTVQAFTSLAIISLLTVPASGLLVAIPMCASAMGCFTRIQEYLLSPTREDQRFDFEPGLSASMSSVAGQDTISIMDVTVRPAANAPPAIVDVNISIKKSSMVMVVGPVGSGKTTLLRAVLGELPCDSGSIAVSSKLMGYCGQTSWLLNTSIQENICNLQPGSAIDETWYQTVVRACVLDQDLLQLPAGDRTLIGSKGLTLSGGQKQRLALARTVYARQDIVLLDDILSALDAKTEESLVNRLLGRDGLFRKLGITVILVTHATRHLPLADEVVVLNLKGQIAQQGDFKTLSLQEGFISRILSQNRNVDEVEEAATNEDQPKSKKTLPGPTVDDLMDLTRRTGDVALYKYYAKSIGWKVSLSLLVLWILDCFAINFPQVWLERWTREGAEQLPLYLSIYVLLTVAASIARFGVLGTVLLKMVPKSSLRLHEILLDTVMRAPHSFFAATDSGVTLNRFSQDMSLIDGPLALAVLITGIQFFNCIAQAALISTGSSYMAITIPFTLLTIYFVQDVYLKTSRQLRFMDLEAKSPLYSHFNETMDGLSTIRAFGWQENARDKHLKALDASQKPFYLLYCVQRWLNLVLDLLTAGLATVVIILAVQLRSSTTGGRLGIALNNILIFNLTLSELVQYWTQLETSLGAIARVRTFAQTTIPEEKPGEDVTPPVEWPERGALDFEHMSASYNGTALALDNINLSIRPGQKIGICGRTGSGKSSLLLTLLRLLDMSSGTIKIDGMDLKTLRRETIRSRMIAIPQDPFMLSGSVRLNADPSETVSDESIVSALRKVSLWASMEDRGGLDAEMQDQPLSQGQQQLFCLARAMLRKSKIVILDEATSNVDRETDSLMQKVIREEFKGHTIITVAHRLDTIMDSDKIAVLDKGKVVEFDSPQNLLARNSIFAQLHGS